MRTIRWLLVAVLAAGLLAGCVSSPEVGNGPATTNVTKLAKSDPLHVVAMLSYASLNMWSESLRSWDAWEDYLNGYADQMRSKGRISENYPVKPSKEDLSKYSKLVNGWLRSSRTWRYNEQNAKEDFNGFVVNWIFKVLERDYDRSR